MIPALDRSATSSPEFVEIPLAEDITQEVAALRQACLDQAEPHKITTSRQLLIIAAIILLALGFTAMCLGLPVLFNAAAPLWHGLCLLLPGLGAAAGGMTGVTHVQLKAEKHKHFTKAAELVTAELIQFARAHHIVLNTDNIHAAFASQQIIHQLQNQ
jgi:hypothetical protein